MELHYNDLALYMGGDPSQYPRASAPGVRDKSYEVSG
jgi:hypothetical protein